MSMLSARILLVIVSASHVWTAILEDVGQVDLEAVRIRLEEEKAKRLLLQNDVEVLMLQLEELKRKYDQKEDKASHVWTAILEDVGQVDLEAVRIRLEEEKAKRLLLQNDVEVLMLQLEELKRKYDQKEDKGTAILENVGRTDLEVIRIQLEQEKTKRLQLQNDLEVMMLKVEKLNRRCDQRDTNCGGMTYVRWGRTVCPGNGTELVYKGYMAGTEHTQSGNGPNNLCLPEDPTWAKYQDGTSDNDHRARVYGTEYEIGHGSFFSPFSPDLADNDVPCAACRTTRSSLIMIPGRTNCYPGWTVEYSGYLVSMYYNHAGSTEYVCLDGDPESIDGGKTDQNGHVIYLADVICGSLRCPPYVNGRELACVLCSK